MRQNAYAPNKPYEELEFRDSFMFGRVMRDRELCHDVLECLLQQPVGELRDPIPEKEIRYTYEGKPIRVDIYTQDDRKVYDAEMQNLNKKSVDSLELPRRTRFYQVAIDTDHLGRGGSYRSLPDSAILYICTFDPFGRDMSKYTFVGTCMEDRDLAINDGAMRIFFNSTYKGDDIAKELRMLYDYIENGVVENELTKRIDGAVREARKVEKWRAEYMFYDINLMDAKEEGIEEGRKEERKNTEAAVKRAEEAENRAENAEALLAKYKEKYGNVI